MSSNNKVRVFVCIMGEWKNTSLFSSLRFKNTLSTGSILSYGDSECFWRCSSHSSFGLQFLIKNRASELMGGRHFYHIFSSPILFPISLWEPALPMWQATLTTAGSSITSWSRYLFFLIYLLAIWQINSWITCFSFFNFLFLFPFDQTKRASLQLARDQRDETMNDWNRFGIWEISLVIRILVGR